MFTMKEIPQEATVSISGFVEWRREQGKICFLGLRSGSEILQCVAFGAAILEPLKEARPGSWLQVEGILRAEPRSQSMGVEFKIKKIQSLSSSLPVEFEEESAEHLWLQRPSLRCRRPVITRALHGKAEILKGMRHFLESEKFLEIQTPKLMGAPSESGAEVFKVEYFGETAYLAQSPQFYKQLAILGGLRKVWEVGPVFRAEKSISSRHATEFCGLDVELEGVEQVEELVHLEHRMLVTALTSAKEALTLSGQEAAFTESLVVPQRLEMIGWEEALQLAGESLTLSAGGERLIGEKMQQKGVELVAILGMPWAQRPFYHQKGVRGESLSFEMIYRGVEITTGAIREHRSEVLQQQLQEKGLKGEGAEFYLEAFKYGATKHGGFGLRVERLTSLWLGLPSIRECSLIPRFPGHISP